MPAKKKKPMHAGGHCAHDEELRKEVVRMRKTLTRIARLERYSLVKHPAKLLAFQFVVGMFRGLGAVIGATVVVAALAFILSFFEFGKAVINIFGL